MRLSIILPFFDEQAFVSMAVRSVLSQGLTADEAEIIIVNDQPEAFGPAYFAGLKFPEMVRVLHHPHNCGLSAARNTGIAAARGRQIGFLDADDYYITGGLARQLADAEASGADISHAQSYISPRGTPAVRLLKRDAALFGRRRVVQGLLAAEEAQFIVSSWSSLYRADFLRDAGLAFDREQVKFEDRLFVLQAVTAAARIGFLGEPVRVWRQRAGSISGSTSSLAVERLRLQLVEKCLKHVRALHQAGRVPRRIERRELFNTVSRLIWDGDIVALIARGEGQDAVDLGNRVTAMLGPDSLGNELFADPLVRRISRVGQETRLGRVTRTEFFLLHKALREGRFADVARRLATDGTAVRSDAVPAAATRQINARLVLHLGMHKTGTTFVQRQLQAHAAALAGRGVQVPLAGLGDGGEAGSRPDGFSGHQGLLRALRDGNVELQRAFLAEVAQQRADHVVVSCENMLQLHAENRDGVIARFFAFFGAFASVQPVAMVRRPDQWFDAHYREIVCGGQRLGARSIAEFAVDHAAQLTNLPWIFAPFEAGAGRAVRLGDFDAARNGVAADRDIWQAFLRLAGLPGADLAVLPVPRYASASRDQVLAAQLASGMLSSAAARVRVLQGFFASPSALGQDGPLMDPAGRVGLVQSFAAASSEFAAARGYAPDISRWLAQLRAEAWTAPTHVDAAVLGDLLQARLWAERPPDPEAPVAQDHGALLRRREWVLRIRPRPWLARLLDRLPLGS